MAAAPSWRWKRARPATAPLPTPSRRGPSERNRNYCYSGPVIRPGSGSRSLATRAKTSPPDAGVVRPAASPHIAAALAAAMCDGLGAPFVAAVETIHNARGRVIVTGMGKSGHVGRKIAATLASTGTPAFFVHAADASH